MNADADADGKARQTRATQLIKPLIPPDAEQRVERSVKQFSPLLREQLRTETGLRLADEKGKTAAPVFVVDGFPDGVARLIDEYDDITLWRLIMLQPKLGAIIEGLKALLDDWDEFEQWSKLPDVGKGGAPVLQRAGDISLSLQKLAAVETVLARIRLIKEDILGVYRFGGNRAPRIEIYWMAQALFSAAFGLRIEDLTAVTLAHELGHAYTHRGRDIGGETWKDQGFAESDAHVVEGLAQFYAAVASERVSGRAQGVFEAYKKLLENQAGPYRAHEEWLKDRPEQRGEIVRFAILRARRLEKVDHAAWIDLLSDTGTSLRGSKDKQKSV